MLVGCYATGRSLGVVANDAPFFFFNPTKRRCQNADKLPRLLPIFIILPEPQKQIAGCPATAYEIVLVDGFSSEALPCNPAIFSSMASENTLDSPHNIKYGKERKKKIPSSMQWMRTYRLKARSSPRSVVSPSVAPAEVLLKDGSGWENKEGDLADYSCAEKLGGATDLLAAGKKTEQRRTGSYLPPRKKIDGRSSSPSSARPEVVAAAVAAGSSTVHMSRRRS
nr:hypothetical protein Iba_chr13dCG9150 [Ipomoea batatas]